jgi:predicted lipoprotein with Yx(FWY)xxD motif
MTRITSLHLLAGVAPVALAAVAVGCGGGGGGATAASPPSKTTSGPAATVGVANSGLGKILVDSQGLTLYLFKKDSGTSSACTGACASAWPPLRANGKPTAGGGASALKLGTTARTDGTPQVTYNGHPLYLFQGDQKAGDTNGQDSTAFGAAWLALSPAGSAITAQASSSGGSGY